VSTGYITIAVGHRRFLEMAVDLALSVRAYDLRPISLVTDAPLRAALGPYRALFDEVVMMPRELGGDRAVKFGLAELSPYTHAMYVDADCLLLDSLELAWQAASGAPLMLVGEHLTDRDDEKHHRHSTRSLMRRFETDVYLKSNSGLVYIDTRAGGDVLRECLQFYRRTLKPALRSPLALPDELAFGVVCGRRRVPVFPQPGPMLWRDEVHALDLASPKKPLLHLIAAPRWHTWTELQSQLRQRRLMCDVPIASRFAWEHRRFKAMFNR
jgi:hypothetical protein